MARRERLDVRWDADDVETARGLALLRGVRPSAVMREAAKIGLSALASAGADANTGRVAVALEAREAVAAHRAGRPLASGSGATMRAGTGSSRPAAPGAAPRPAPGAEALTRLEIVVAQELAQRAGAPRFAPADVARARRVVLNGRVTVDGQACRNPAQMVERARVAVA